MKKIILATALVTMAIGAAPLTASALTYDRDGCAVSSNSPTPDSGFCSNNAIANGLQPRGSNH